MTYLQLTPPDAPRGDWLAARRSGVGGSDVAAILGLNRYSSPLAVWLDKTGDTIDDPAGEAAEWGHRIEPIIAEKWAESHEHYGMTTNSPGLLARADATWMLATPDRFVWPCSGPNEGQIEVWEGKTAGARQMHRWDDDATPDEYVLQVRWYMAVTGARRGYISALLAGQRYVERTVEADDDFEAMLISRVGEWWQRHIVDGAMPDPDPSRDGELLGTLWKALDTEPADLTDLADVVSDLRAVRASIAHLREQEDSLTTAVKVALADRTEGHIDGVPVVTWRASKPRTTFDAKAFAAEHPDVHVNYLRTGEPVRSFRLKEIS